MLPPQMVKTNYYCMEICPLQVFANANCCRVLGKFSNVIKLVVSKALTCSRLDLSIQFFYNYTKTKFNSVTNMLLNYMYKIPIL